MNTTCEFPVAVTYNVRDKFISLPCSR